MDAVRPVTDPEQQCDRLAATTPRRVRARFAAWLPALFLPVFLALTARAATDSLPVLRTAHQAHTLSTTEAIRGYPVHLDRAQITFYDSTIHSLFLMDATDGIFVDARGDQAQDVPQAQVTRALGNVVDEHRQGQIGADLPHEVHQIVLRIRQEPGRRKEQRYRSAVNRGAGQLPDMAGVLTPDGTDELRSPFHPARHALEHFQAMLHAASGVFARGPSQT